MALSLRRFMLAVCFGLSVGPAAAASFDIEDLQVPTAPITQPKPFAIIGGNMDDRSKLEFIEALRLFSANQFSQSETMARRLTETISEEPGPWYLLGLTLANLDRKEEALVALDKATELYDVNAEPLLVKGDLLLSMGREDEAIKSWQAATDRDPDNWNAQDRLASLAERRGDRVEAARRYELSLKTAGEVRPFPRLQLARIALLDGQPEKVEPLLKDLAAKPDAPDQAIDYLARAMIGLDRLDDAEPLLNTLIERGTSAAAFPHLARIHLAKGNAAEAEAVMARATEAFPDIADMLLEQGRVLGAIGKYDQAMIAFDKGLAIAPNNRSLLNAASLAKTRSGAMDDAVLLARRATEQADAAVSDWMWLAGLLEKTGGEAEAGEIYRAVLKTEPQNWVALNNLASILTPNDPVEAVKLAEMAVSLSPGVPQLRATLGWAQFKAGRTDASISTFRSLRTENPESSLPIYRLGMVQAVMGNLDEAKALMTEALSRDPQSPHAELAKQVLAGQSIAP